MRWPWQKTERRSSGGYSDAILRIIAGKATGTDADALATAGVEAAAGALSRAFMSCRVAGDARIASALPGAVLGRVGRDLVRQGDSLHVIDTDGGSLRLLPAASWTVEGEADPETWRFKAEIGGPTETRSVRRPWAGVVYVQWASHPGRPHEGEGPMACAPESGKLAAAIEATLAAELGGPVGSVIPVPSVDQPEGEGDPLEGMTTAIRDLGGGVFLAETTQAGWQGDRSERPRGDWRPARIGGSPPAATVQLRQHALAGVLAACGVPVALLEPADGTAAREALRRFWIGTVVPLLRILKAEIETKLEGDCEFRFDPYVLDMTGRAKVYTDLRAAEIPEDEARRMAGLDVAGVV